VKLTLFQTQCMLCNYGRSTRNQQLIQLHVTYHNMLSCQLVLMYTTASLYLVTEYIALYIKQSFNNISCNQFMINIHNTKVLD